MTDATIRDDAAAYALGAMDAGDRAAFELLVERDAALGRDVEAYRRVAAMLAYAAPVVVPPAALRARVLSTLEPAVEPVRPMSLTPVASARPVPPAPARPQWMQAVPWLALAASLAWVFVSTRTAGRERADHAAAMVTNDSLRARVASLDSVVDVLLAPQVETVNMSATGAPPRARMYWNPATRQLVLAAYQLPPADSGRIYQLWGIPAGQTPVSLGTFNTDASGTARVSLTVPAGLTISVGAVTDEPAGGSPQPTTTPFLVGQVGG